MSKTVEDRKLELINEAQQLIFLKQLALVRRPTAEGFLFFLEKFVKTQDEHDQLSPFKPFPSPSEKPYLYETGRVFVEKDRVAVEKSRQMMISWLASAFALWYTMFFDGRRTFIQSKKEADANGLIDRIKTIYRQLPEVFREQHKANEPMAYLKLEFGKQQSIIQGLPQGEDVIRQYTSSLIISDEVAFQDKAESAYMAAQPTIMGGGKIILISSPNFKEFFYRVVRDEI